MIVPNKFLRLEETSLGKIKFILLEEPKSVEISITDLFDKVAAKFDTIEEFVYALDILFLIQKLDWHPARRVISYVK